MPVSGCPLTGTKTPKGQKLMEEYDKYKTLCPESCQTLVKITVAQLVEECGPLVLHCINLVDFGTVLLRI